MFRPHVPETVSSIRRSSADLLSSVWCTCRKRGLRYYVQTLSKQGVMIREIPSLLSSYCHSYMYGQPTALDRFML